MFLRLALTQGPRSAVARFLSVLVLGLCVIAVLTACSTSESTPTDDQSSAKQLSPSDFAQALKSDSTFVLNVHTPDEGSLSGTDAAIPFDEIRERASELPPDRNTKLAVYCRSGRMSRIAVSTLAKLGYTDLVELHGGMDAWKKSGRRLMPPT